MAQYRARPVVIEAFRLPGVGEPPEPFLEWAASIGFTNYESGPDESLIIPTPEGDMQVSPGDWVIKGTIGEFYPCKDEVFRAKYELVPTEAAKA